MHTSFHIYIPLTFGCLASAFNKQMAVEVGKALGDIPTSSINEPGLTVSPARPDQTGIALPSSGTNSVVSLSQNSVSLGNLNGQNLYGKMWTALQSQCPDVQNGPQNCKANQVTIDGVENIITSTPTDGSITLTIDQSAYSSNSERQALLGAAINSIVNAAGGQNCQNTNFAVRSGAPCPQGSKSKRRGLTTVESGDNNNNNNDSLDKRIVQGATGVCKGSMNLCAAPDSVNVEINTPTLAENAHMNLQVGWRFDTGGDSAFLNFLCDVAMPLVQTAMAAAAPEVDAIDWATLGSVNVSC